MVDAPIDLQALLAASQAESAKGAGSMPTAAPSPQTTAPTGIPGSGPSGVSPAQPLSPSGVYDGSEPAPQPPVMANPAAVQPQTTPMPGEEAQPDLQQMLAASEAESQKPPSEAPQGQTAMQNYTGGMNGRLGDAVHSAYWFFKKNPLNPAVIYDSVKNGKSPLQVYQELFGNSKEEAESRNNFKAAIHDTLGISMGAEEGSTAGHIGKNTVDAMASLGMFYAAAPSLAASEGMSIPALIKRTFGQALIDHPWLAVTSDIVGGVPGSTIGEEKFGAPGAIVGGVVGNVATAPAQALGRKVLKIAQVTARNAVETIDAFARKAGIQNPPIESLGMKGPQPIVPDDVVDAYRSAESEARAAGERTVTAARDWVVKKNSPMPADERFKLMHDHWEAQQAEKAAADKAEEAFMAIPKEVRGKYSREAMAIRDQFADINYPKQFAEDQIAGDTKLVQDRIDRALRQVQPLSGVTAEEAAVKINQGIQDSEKLATKIEAKYWARVDQKQRMPTRSGPLGDLDMFNNEIQNKFSPSQIPGDAIQGFYNLFAPKGAGNNLFQKNPTIERVRSEITALRQARYKELSQDAPDSVKLALMTRLEGLANKWVGEAFPTDVPLQQARAFSTQYHDIFSRSELYPFLQTGRRGQDKIRPEDTLTTLIKRPHGMEDLYDMTDKLLNLKRIPKQDDAYPTALNPKQRQIPLELQQNVEDGIRASFQEEVANRNADPLQVQKIVTKWEPRIKMFSKVTAEIQQNMGDALKGVQDRRAIEESALKKYFQSNDTETAVNRVWSAPNGPAVVKALINGEAGVGGFANDPVALEGFRSAMVDKFIKTAGGAANHSRMSDLLVDTKTSRTMEAALGRDRFDRLQAVISRLHEMDTYNKESHVIRNSLWAARWIGVKVAAFVPNFGHGGELQQAALFSEIAKRQVLQYFKQGDPVTMLGEVIRNPSMERLLLSKAPEDYKQMKASLLLMRRVLRFDMGLRGAYDASQDQEPGKTKPSASIEDMKQVASLQQKLPNGAEDYNESAKVINQDAHRDHIQGPANTLKPRNPFQGVPIVPGEHHIPSNMGPNSPWNTVL